MHKTSRKITDPNLIHYFSDLTPKVMPLVPTLAHSSSLKRASMTKLFAVFPCSTKPATSLATNGSATATLYVDLTA
jgi:hypothetical protein